MIRQIFYTGSSPIQKPIQSVLNTPTISISFILPPNTQQIKKKVTKDSYFCFFSKNSVLGFEACMGKPKAKKIFSVGASTSELIQKKWQINPIEPKEKTAIGMTQLFSNLPKKQVILPTGKKGRKEFTNWLTKNNWNFYSILVYETTIVENSLLQEKFLNLPSQCVVFTSPSTVKGFLKTMKIKDLRKIKARVASIGPTTTASIHKYNGSLYYQSPKPNIIFLIQQLSKIS